MSTQPSTALDGFIEQFGEETGYLDFARVGPVGRAVVEEAQAHSSMLATGRFGSFSNLQEEDLRVRAAVGGLLGFEADQVVFQPSRGQALMQVMFGLSGEVAIAADEYPGSTFAVARAADALGRLSPRWIDTEGGRLTPGNLKPQLDDEVTAVVLSAVGFRNGYRADIEGVRQVIGDRLLIIDATHAVGVIDAPFMLADAVVGGGQAWLRAGWGAGFLALSERALARLQPVLSGYPAAADVEPPPGEVPAPQSGAAAFQVSVPDPVSQARLAAAAEAIAAVGVPPIKALISQKVLQLLELADEFAIPVDSPRDPAERAGIVVLRPDPGHPASLPAALHNHGVTATVRDGVVRLGPHVSTTEDTVAALRAAFVEYATVTKS